ncbi:FkbM family methyltransferase [Salmonella enterica]|nr:FkbM family methyltransferase [Salmonella enterica]EHW4001298.1 FkbM family methyltransferase [Salmonella enterica]
MTALNSISITLNGQERDFFYRDIHSDRSVIEQNFINKEYSTGMFARDRDIQARYRDILAAGMKPVIVDCGANIGTSVLHFLGEYPQARVVALEPAPDNFALLELNTRGLDVELIPKGVSSSEGMMELVDTGEPFAYRLSVGQSVSRSVGQSVSLPVTTMTKILEAYQPESLFILKVDIEGGEKELFSGDISRADDFYVCMVELHDWLYPGERTSAPFLRWSAAADRDFIYRGENIFSVKNIRKNE